MAPHLSRGHQVIAAAADGSKLKYARKSEKIRGYVTNSCLNSRCGTAR